jgi:hypothetical protein
MSGSFVDRVSRGEPYPRGVGLPCDRVMMALIHVHRVMESFHLATIGWIPSLECLLEGTRGSQWLRLVLSNIKCPHCPRAPTPRSLTGIGDSRARLLWSQVCAELGQKLELSRVDRWRGPTRPWLLMWDRKDRCGSYLGLVPFMVVVPPRWGGTISGMKYLVLCPISKFVES